VAIKKTVECDHCGTVEEYDKGELWIQLYRTPLGYSPSYDEDIPLLFPKCQRDLNRFMEKENENGKKK